MIKESVWWEELKEIMELVWWEGDFVKKRREEDFGENGTCDLHIQYLLLIEKEISKLQLMHTSGQTYNSWLIQTCDLNKKSCDLYIELVTYTDKHNNIRTMSLSLVTWIILWVEKHPLSWIKSRDFSCTLVTWSLCLSAHRKRYNQMR